MRLREYVLLCIFLLAAAAPLSAQPQPPVGVRAAGMAGAFTAVADDASAVYWNPAGLATGSFFSLVLDYNNVERESVNGDGESGNGDRRPGNGERGSGSLIALGTPPLGVSYYRTDVDDRSGAGYSIALHHAGVTVLQSLGHRVAVGATVKLVHGVVSAGGTSISANKFDTDIGVVTTGSLARFGLSVRNLAAPEFDVPGGGTAKLDRRVRAGVAVNTTRRTVTAADFDLTTADTPRGEWRDAAVGVEANPLKKAWVRGGVRWNTASGPSAPIGTAGASVAVYGSILADAQVSFGSDDGNRGWGAGLRFVF